MNGSETSSSAVVPRLSVVCITYNAAQYIRAALDGFLMQKTDFPFEVLVHDDASTDGTAEIIREYAEKRPDVVRAVFQKENQWSKGVAVAPKFLWPLIRGEYVAMCEGDDYWTDPLKLQKQVDWLDAHPDSSVCFHPVVVHFEDGSRKDSVYPSRKDCPRGFTFEGLLAHNFIQTNSVVFRWKLKGREAEFPTDIAPRDWFTNLIHAEKGPIGFIPDGRVSSPFRRRLVEFARRARCVLPSQRISPSRVLPRSRAQVRLRKPRGVRARGQHRRGRAKGGER